MPEPVNSEQIGPALKEFSDKVCRYFLDFLETDFKRQQAPRRRIQLKTDTGFRSGIALRKYPRLYEEVWALCIRSIAEGLTLRLPRKRYTALISPTLRDLIRQHVEALPGQSFAEVRSATIDYSERHRGRVVEHPEKYIEDVQLAFREAVGERIVRPILSLLEGPFLQQSYSAIESVYEVETDLVDMLTAPTLEQLPMALNTYVVRGTLEPARAVMEEFFSEKEAKERIVAFFEDFATADAFQELRDLLNFARTADNLQFYLYLCELRFGTSSYPLFYIPATVIYDEQRGDYAFDFDPHLFVNKRAVDFVLQELRGEANRLPISPVDERIIYIPENQSFIVEIERVLRRLAPTFDLAGVLDLRQGRIQVASSAALKLSNTAYFAVFDKSDEALLNDYEELLAAVNADQQAASNLFSNIIANFLLNEPKSIRQSIDDQWEGISVPDRLLAVSPIPVNEEQRKILNALRDPDCRYIVIQGPPGTGKSHTITAIAFDCILAGKNILVLSDKQEALDVVQDKLETALSAIRHGDDFPNPILRLGRIGGSYTRLISQSSQERIRQQYRAHRANADRLRTETRDSHQRLKGAIEQTIQAYGEVKLSEIEELHRLEQKIEQKLPGYAVQLQELRNTMVPLSILVQSATALDGTVTGLALAWLSEHFERGTLEQLFRLVQQYLVLQSLIDLRDKRVALSLFTSLGPHQEAPLATFITEYEALRMPLFGFIFRGEKVRAVGDRLAHALPCPNPLDLHKRLADLRDVVSALGRIRRTLIEAGLSESDGELIYRLLLSTETPPKGLTEVKQFLKTYHAVFGSWTREGGAALKVDGAQFTTIIELFSFLRGAVRYAELWDKVKGSINSAPALDYVGEKAKLERLYTSKMTHEIDRRFIEFIESSRTTAITLGGVIRAKQQFPQDSFDSLKQAFPCIIAGIREFAEYVPLKHKLFDVVVIDEASQVSVAQAFPALLRADKVVVFGDKKQFSNVKAAQASNLLNASYLTETEAFFRARISTAADKIQRLKQFDVKKSILEFFDLIASYNDMLRKHFRGYQELISFSSKHFYGGQLQAIKVRGKLLDEVIRFTLLKHDGRQERYRNVNTPEAEFILQELKRMVVAEEGMTVGVITPFREQQQYLSRILFGDLDAQRFETDLKLKIMTFDTCQGEERDIIFYSMVATGEHDVLNYVFPVDMEDAADQAEEKLKMQRLNVGFSRAKEEIHFVLSKPVEQFRGSIGRALAHFSHVLKERPFPEPGDTDPSSPMERKVLDWLQKTSFYQINEERLEVIAQFPVGDYLRQLDPFYQHPRYRCDFLLRHHGEERQVNVVIEYDGFTEHFTEHRRIHEGNWDQYYRPEDVERQLVLESYGYKFLRINRFNLGRDPVQALSDRLERLIESANNRNEPQAITRIRNDAEGLADGTAKHCQKCGRVKQKEEFYDPKLNRGQGSFGQICMDCKRKGRTTKSGRRWRRY